MHPLSAPSLRGRPPPPPLQLNTFPCEISNDLTHPPKFRGARKSRPNAEPCSDSPTTLEGGDGVLNPQQTTRSYRSGLSPSDILPISIRKVRHPPIGNIAETVPQIFKTPSNSPLVQRIRTRKPSKFPIRIQES